MNRTGTVTALTASLAFNGQTLNAVEFGVLANVLGDSFATKVGFAPRPAGQRGKASTLWTISDNAPITVTEVQPVADTVAETASDATDEVVGQRDESADPVSVEDVANTELG